VTQTAPFLLLALAGASFLVYGDDLFTRIVGAGVAVVATAVALRVVL